MKYFCSTLIFLSICIAHCFGEINRWSSRFSRAPLLERFSWKQLDWQYPDEITRNEALASGEYQPQNGLPVGIEIWKNKLFVTVPRWKVGQFFY